jgi:hypothetical protein
MAGIRVQHPTERNVMFTLVDGSRPYQAPYDCPECHFVHEFKTYHLKLDETGACIVSEEIVERLRRIPGQPMRIGEEVKKPPARKIGPVGRDR